MAAEQALSKMRVSFVCDDPYDSAVRCDFFRGGDKHHPKDCKNYVSGECRSTKAILWCASRMVERLWRENIALRSKIEGIEDSELPA